MWDQLSDLKIKFPRLKRRPEKMVNLSEKKLGVWTVINSLRYSCLVWYTKNVLYKINNSEYMNTCTSVKYN